MGNDVDLEVPHTEGQMTTIYKLTDQKMQTHNGYQWELGKRHQTNGKGELCGPGFFHGYTDPLLAVLLNPVHAVISNPRLFEGIGKIAKTDYGLKIGCVSLELMKELPLPIVNVEQWVRFAILCAKAVYDDASWNVWADTWLSGEDRTAEAIETTMEKVVGAAGAEGTAAWSAAWAAQKAEATRVAAVAAETAKTARATTRARAIEAAARATAEKAAAWAAVNAAKVAEIDLIAIAQKAVKE